MASFAPDNRPSLPAPTDDSDPFVSNSSAPTHHRYSDFDHDLFAAGPGSSPRQAKRALEAHLAETERRLDEAGKLGTALVSQRKALTEQLEEVEKLQAEGELNPDLRRKLVDIEKEYNDLARESARAFLPKQRVPSNEANPGSPYVPEGRSGRRSVSPSKFESQATGSPTKLSVPNRKIRNQPSNRNHDIEFAAEISQSLIVQVRNLQALLAERDEEVRDLKSDKSSLEIETESLQQRLKALDESEHRYKEENWNLETRLQELSSQQRDAIDREKKLTQSLNLANTDKTAVQNKLDEVKLSHAKLVEDHAASVKQADIELGTAKRNMVQAEGERSAMQRKIDDLTNQNQELARAFSQQRGRATEREPASGQSEDDLEAATDNATPEHSPPPSPIKGTPRHSMLESETIKTSLHHAQRTIQSQRNQIHREKTEKLELRRMIQDLRDDLERTRTENATGASNRRSRKVESKEFKKNSRLLGNFRSSRQEVLADDPEWEDNMERSPRSAVNAGPATFSQIDDGNRTDTTDHFETANEASESAFETANDERGTETEDFQTVNEAMSGSDDALTETESTSRGFGRMRPPPSLPAGLSRHVPRESFDSTASTSTDDDEYVEVKTPTAAIASQRRGFRLSKGPFGRNARQASEEPSFKSSPASFISSNGDTPQAGQQQSLFAELQDFAGSDEESVGNATPSRRSARSATPGSTRRPYSPPPALPPLPKAIMVDSGVMTDPVDVRDVSDVSAQALPMLAPPKLSPGDGELERPTSMQSVIATPGNRDSAWLSDSRPVSMFAYSDAGSQHDPDMSAKLAQFPVPPTFAPPALSVSGIQSEILEPQQEPEEPEVKPQALGFVTIATENVDPIEVPEVLPTPPALGFTSIAAHNLDPIPEHVEPPVRPALGYTSLSTERVQPIAEPAIPQPALSLSTVGWENVAPVAVPDPPLALSQITNQTLSPIQEPEIPRPSLSIARVGSQHWEPRVEPSPPAPPLAMASLQSAVVDPIAEPLPIPHALGLSGISGEHVEPIAVPEPEPLPVPVAAVVREPEPEPVVAEPPTLVLSTIGTEDIEPIKEPEVVIQPPALDYSLVNTENVEPVAEPEPVPTPLLYSSINTENVKPIAEPEPIPTALFYSAINTENVRPLAEPEPEPIPLHYSSINAENVRPVSEPVSEPASLGRSLITAESVSPVSETIPELAYSLVAGEAVEPGSLPFFGLTPIASVDTEPVTPRSPKRHAFIMPRDWDSDSQVVIAEDETRQSPVDTAKKNEPDVSQPFKDISNTAASRSDQGAQTSLTADAIENLFRSRSPSRHVKDVSVSSFGSPGSTNTVRIHGRDREHDRTASPVSARGRVSLFPTSSADSGPIRRPSSATSAASARTTIHDAPTPPLPSNHRQLIEAARTGSSSGAVPTASSAAPLPPPPPGSMPPPAWPASAMKNRPQTPKEQRPASGRGTPTPRATRSNQAVQNLARPMSPGRLTARSRQSSVSSFASELDTRFNMRPGEMDPTGLGSTSDPRMIQAITQTMIGEYLWKYTRKTGRADMSEKRHRRYFWLHPYTRTLYWSDGDPSSSGRQELKAKSVPIEAVRVVTDDNPMPPGLHRKSLIVIAPGRSVKFTCTTGQRHETWFNALSYLLMRTNEDGQGDVEEVAQNITQDDVDEFNPQYGQRPANGNRARAPPSLSSYNSRTTRNQSPPADMMGIPTLTPSSQRGSQQNLQTPGQPQRPSASTLSKFSGYFRSSSSRLSGNLGSFRGRGASGQNHSQSIYEASEVHDSAEDLREMIEQQDREADRLENVRACCDGKHDVGTLHHLSKRGRVPHQHSHHSHPGPSATPTPMASMRSRA